MGGLNPPAVMAGALCCCVCVRGQTACWAGASTWTDWVNWPVSVGAMEREHTPSLLSQVWAGFEPENLQGRWQKQGLASEVRVLDIKDIMPHGDGVTEKDIKADCTGQELLGSLG